MYPEPLISNIFFLFQTLHMKTARVKTLYYSTSILHRSVNEYTNITTETNKLKSTAIFLSASLTRPSLKSRSYTNFVRTHGIGWNLMNEKDKAPYTLCLNSTCQMMFFYRVKQSRIRVLSPTELLRKARLA